MPLSCHAWGRPLPKGAYAARGGRRGLASLELVMVVPLLLLMAALIFKIGEGYLRKCETNVAARRYAAVPRSAPGEEPAPLPHDPIVIAALAPESGQAGLVRQPAERSLRLNPIGNGRAAIRGRHVVLFGSWDYRAVPFADRDASNPSDPRAFRMAALGLLDSILPQFPVDPSAAGVSPNDLLTMVGGQLLKAIPAVQQASDALDTLKKPQATLKNLTNTIKGLKDLISDKDKLKQAISNLPKVPDAVNKAKGLVQKLFDLNKDPVPDDV